ncbi:MAG: hypothetical protein AAGG44_05860 [Planctomycetota bacterium]
MVEKDDSQWVHVRDDGTNAVQDPSDMEVLDQPYPPIGSGIYV